MPAGTSTRLEPGRLAENFITYAEELARLALQSAESCAADVDRATALVADALKKGNKVIACGNGGSAADAQHFVAEFVGRYCGDRMPLPAISLTSDSSILTALGNDFGFEEIFARQVRALGQPGDVLVAISTSGKSRNVLRAAEVAHELGMSVVALTGDNGDASLATSDAWCRISSRVTAHIQEIHMMILHSICIGVESRFDFNGPKA
ncbi:MAG: SIS domain-containing protein [Acidimicrobiaceae bacterium]|nr:SIS domain-containing protein [Acidimicrobiaceae bacterium]